MSLVDILKRSTFGAVLLASCGDTVVENHYYGADGSETGEVGLLVANEGGPCGGSGLVGKYLAKNDCYSGTRTPFDPDTCIGERVFILGGTEHISDYHLNGSVITVYSQDGSEYVEFELTRDFECSDIYNDWAMSQEEICDKAKCIGCRSSWFSA